MGLDISESGFPNLLIEALRQEGVEPSQAVVGVSDADEARLHSLVQQGAVNGLRGHDLAHVSDVHETRWGDARGDGVRAAFLQLLSDDVSPANRYSHQSLREKNINLPLRRKQQPPMTAKRLKIFRSR